MAKIYAPNKQYSGVVATVTFVDGVGETNSPHLIDYFDRKGYTIKDKQAEKEQDNNVKLEDTDEKNIEDMSYPDLKKMAKKIGVKDSHKMKKEKLVEVLKASDTNE
jgi:hypothetical protein